MISPSERDLRARHLLEHCGALAPGERVVVVVDARTRDLGTFLAAAAATLGASVDLLEEPLMGNHGVEPSAATARSMSSAALIVGLTTMSMAHTRARRAATDGGARYLSLPDYSWEVFLGTAMGADFRAHGPLAERVAAALSDAPAIRVTSPAGTDLRLQARGRRANACPGCVLHPGDLGSPPDIETNIAPLETLTEGRIVVDGSITHPQFGLLTDSVALDVESGRVVRFSGERDDDVRRLEEIFRQVGSPAAYTVAELGIGLNEHAVLNGNMLNDEGVRGTVHFGLGSNGTIGGASIVSFHLDFVLREATVTTSFTTILSQGTLFP